MAVKPVEKPYTVDDLLALPDDGKRYELINRDIVEVGTSSQKHALAGGWFVEMLRSYIRGRVTGADGKNKLDELNTKSLTPPIYLRRRSPSYDAEPCTAPLHPIWPIEIRSPSSSMPSMRILAALYLRTGTRMVWTVDLEATKVYVYRPGHDTLELGENDVLEGFDVLPGLKLNLAELFVEIEDD